jgi:chromosome segregation protein
VNLEVAQQRYESAMDNLNALLQTRASSEAKVNSLRTEIAELQQHQERLSAEITQTQEHLRSLIATHDERDHTLNDEKDRIQHLEATVAENEASIKKLRAIEDEIEPRIHSLDLELKEVSLRGEHLRNEIADRYGCAIPELSPPGPTEFSVEEHQARLDMLRQRLTNIGEVNLAAATEYDESKKRYDFLYSQEQDLTQSLESLQKVIARINRTTKEKFQDAFSQVNAHFQEIFPILFHGGKAYLSLTDETDLLETGIEIFVQPAGKKMQSLDLLSGGERSLTVVALIFAIFLTKPSPFCLLDEIDAALDDSNIDRFNQHLQKMSAYSQFIMVTHSKQSMQAANTLYGVTMQEQGVSKIVSVELH